MMYYMFTDLKYLNLNLDGTFKYPLFVDTFIYSNIRYKCSVIKCRPENHVRKSTAFSNWITYVIILKLITHV